MKNSYHAAKTVNEKLSAPKRKTSSKNDRFRKTGIVKNSSKNSDEDIHLKNFGKNIIEKLSHRPFCDKNDYYCWMTIGTWKMTTALAGLCGEHSKTNVKNVLVSLSWTEKQPVRPAFVPKNGEKLALMKNWRRWDKNIDYGKKNRQPQKSAKTCIVVKKMLSRLCVHEKLLNLLGYLTWKMTGNIKNLLLRLTRKTPCAEWKRRSYWEKFSSRKIEQKFAKTAALCRERKNAAIISIKTQSQKALREGKICSVHMG